MTRSSAPSEAPPPPVLFVHASGSTPAGALAATILAATALADRGFAVCSRSGGAGVQQTRHGFDEPLPLLRELAQRFPGQAVAFVRAGLEPTLDQLEALRQIVAAADEPLALTLLSNADTALNPFAGLRPPETPMADEPGDLVALLAPGYLHTLTQWPGHFCLLSAATLQRMGATETKGNLLECLEAAGGRLAVPDHLFVHDGASPLFDAWALEPHESLYPPAFGDLSARLQDWLDAGVGPVPSVAAGAGPATLHITHSWGGGIAQWIRSCIEADGEGLHYQLRAEGPQSDCGYGQRLSLYVGNELGCPIARWWLSPPVRSVEDHCGYYREVLERICRRYRIGRVRVSSLIGHTLDVFRTGLPTVQVLHDNFPLWPLLSVHPGAYLREAQRADLEAGLAAQHDRREFEDKNAAAWEAIGDAYIEALSRHDVGIAAPGRSVLDMQHRLDPRFDAGKAHIIPHGLPAWPRAGRVQPKTRSDGRRRLVVLGRIQPGKGQKLLAEALPELTEHVQVYLLGSGKSGEVFFGKSGVNVVPEYERNELPELLESIGPDFAALLSIVPETFSYTLSELQSLGIPAIATRVGNFPDRIEHGRTGWLIEPGPAALVRQVADLCASPNALDTVRGELGRVAVSTTRDMVAAYEQAFPDIVDPGPFQRAGPGPDGIQFAAAQYALVQARRELEEGAEREGKLRAELDDRTAWVQNVKDQLRRANDMRVGAERALTETRAELARRSAEYQSLLGQYQAKSDQLDRILGSTSWKLTRPLRVASRLKLNAQSAGAWKPLRWPGLLAGLAGNVSRYGWRRALVRLQETTPNDLAGADDAPAPEVPVLREPDPPRSIARVGQPGVSIVIPVHNHWSHTAACLRSLAETPSGRPFEIIVVDDASSDETRSELQRIDGLTCLRNETNLGFVGSCNRGAAAASGAYLVMLNNDTQVQPGWLDALIDTLEAHPDAGLVGARLVYPDGRLQESGGIIFSDGSGWNYGREDVPDRPEYRFLREADYCSGACIALRTDLFREFGGFDERYAPAYYEDTDLAFRVREKGLKVLIQPAATVIHHEGVTSGTDTSSGIKQYQCINQDKFVERWREALARQPAPVHDKSDRRALREASRHRVQRRMLFVAGQVPEFGGAEPGGRLAALISCAGRLGYGVTFLADDAPADESGEIAADRWRSSGVEIVYSACLRSVDEFFSERGAGLDAVLVSGEGPGARCLPSINRYCARSVFLFDAAPDGSSPGGSDSDLPALPVIRAADITLVADRAGLERLQRTAPGKRLVVHSGPEAGAGDDVCKALESWLTTGS